MSDEHPATDGGLPTGTVTFVLADVVGSTRLWEEHPEGMAAALARLDQLVDEGTARHGGSRPVEQGEGDSFVVAFARAIDAAGLALDLARSMNDETWPGGIELRLRMALHTGDARLRDDGRYMGEALNRCARVRALGHGGQVLVTNATADLVADHLGDRGFLRSLGVHQLRDLTRPERVAQLCAPGLPFDFPPLRSLDRLPNNLPLQTTSFIGRTTELAAVASLLDGRRMVTVTGSGGCGKTRLAVQLGAELLDHYGDGVWLADLAPQADPELVPKAVADAFGVGEHQGESMSATVTEHLRDKELLLLLDNCEHLLDACADLVEDVLRQCPGIAVLATSREPLGVDGEATYPLPSLAVPTHAGDADCESVALFADRAALARPTLRIGPANLAAVTDICTRLDGIPLALELAAARCRALTPVQIADQLDNRFGLLTGGRRARLPRQRTLEASVDWSYGLLADGERAVLRRLSVFAGGFTLDAVEAVCSDDDVGSGWDVVDTLTSLVDKSLVQGGDDNAEPRYRLLETIRQYAGQKLIDAGEAADVRQRHADWYVQVAEEAFSGLFGPEVIRCETHLASELDNLRTADDWAAETGQADLALRFAGREFWFRRHPGEGLRRVRRALGLPGGTPTVRAQALLVQGELGFSTGDYEGMRVGVEEAVRIAEETGDDCLRGMALSYLAWSAFVLNEGDCRQNFEVSREMLREHGDPFWVVDNLLGSAFADLYAGDPEGARRHLSEGLDLARGTGSPVAIGRMLMCLGHALVFEGSLDEAEAKLNESRPLLVACGDGWARCHADAGLVWVACGRGDTNECFRRADEIVAEARRLYQMLAAAWALLARMFAEFRSRAPGHWPESLDEAEATSEAEVLVWGVALCRAVRAECLLGAGDPSAARRCAEGAVALAGSTIYAGHSRGRALLALARTLRAGDDLASAEDVGHEALVATRAIGARHELTEVLEFLAGLAAEADSAEEATRIFAAAATARDHLGYPRPPVEEPAVTGDLGRALAALDEATFAAAWAEGAAMSLDDAIAYASRGRGARKRPASGWASLTPAELEVVRLVAAGLRNAEVAAKLFISAQTVKTHLSHVFAKLEVSTRAELAALAARRG